MKKPAPEFLLIDVGNTRTKYAVAGKRWPGRVVGDVATSEITVKWVTTLARKFPSHLAVVASVVPKLTSSFHKSFAGRVEIVSGNSPALRLTFAYPKPVEIGADRLAAAIAAHAWGQYPAIIVACGTATAFTVLDANGQLCGGAIAPGLETQLAALLGRTAQLPDTLLKQPRSALGKSSQEAIRSGVVLNFQGGAKEIIRQLTKTLPGRSQPQVILTGGHAPHLAKNLDVPHTLRPLLIFEGLLIIGFRAFGLTP